MTTNKTISTSVKLTARFYLKMKEILSNWNTDAIPYNVYYFKEGINER